MGKSLVFGIMLGLALVSLAAGVYAYQVSGTYYVTFENSVHKGWNIVASGYYIPDKITADSEIKKADIGAMYYYSNCQNSYIMLYPNPDNVKIEKQKACEDHWDELAATWVYSNKDGMLKYETGLVQPLKERNLKAGWNFVSITSEFAGKNLIAGEGSCNITKVYGFDSSAQNWNNLLADLTAHNYPTDTGNAFLGTGELIHVTNDCQLGISQGGGSAAAPPAVPY